MYENRNNGSDENEYENYDQEYSPYDEQEQGEFVQEQYEDESYYEDHSPYEEEAQEPEIVSTNQAINLTCTLAAMSGIFALFLYVADKRSNAVRRISVQSVALESMFLGLSIVLWFVGMLFGLIPILGTLIGVALWLVFIALLIGTLFLKYKMMFNAYQGFAYLLPALGERIRRFE